MAKDDNLVQISVRIRVDVRRKIQELADKESRSFSNMVALLLTRAAEKEGDEK
jgi:predicted transcriptional regulator